MKKRLFAAVCAFFLFCMAMAGCDARNPSATTDAAPTDRVDGVINWTLYCTRISPDGNCSDKFQISVQGEFRDLSKEADRLDIAFTFPEHYRYSFSQLTDLFDLGYEHRIQTDHFPDFFVAATYSYDILENEAVFVYFALDAEREYMIFKWDNDDCYIVASADPDADPAAVFAHFEGFRQTFCKH